MVHFRHNLYLQWLIVCIIFVYRKWIIELYHLDHDRVRNDTSFEVSKCVGPNRQFLPTSLHLGRDHEDDVVLRLRNDSWIRAQRIGPEGPIR
jgi:hypothetical protein